MINTRYEIIKKLGEGRSSVFLCRDIEFPEKEYAMKILAPGREENEKAAFLREYFILKKLEHPNIIEAFDFGKIFITDGEENIKVGSDYIIMEYFKGSELLFLEHINNESSLKEIVKQICSVLFYLHQSKYIYYDLKPENILVSVIDGYPEIRLIDLGFAEYSPSSSEYEIKGTAHYIAPELLKKEAHNHTVDFYSLGMLLYRVVYNHFPYNSENELGIYKAAIDNTIEFPPNENFSSEFIQIIQKLLEKEVNRRYNSALAIIEDLNFTLDNSITKEFLPARVFACRDYAVNVISKYISDMTSSEVFTLKGFDGVGKTALLLKIQELYPDSILISDAKGKSAGDLIRYILRKITFSNSVYPNLSDENRSLLFNILSKSEKEIINELRSAIILLSSTGKFTLLIDDINLFDQLSLDMLLEITPILQVSSNKIIISESSEHNFISSRLNNVRDLSLGPFTDSDLDEFLDGSFYADFPRQTLREYIVLYSDLIPGNIKSFIKDLILLRIMKFSGSGVTFADEDDKLAMLKTSHLAIYDLRLANLSETELRAVKVLSAIDAYQDHNTLSRILELPLDVTDAIIDKLHLNNLIQRYNAGQSILFSSETVKKHVYASIQSKQELHINLARTISEKLPTFNKPEEARQYELGGDYEMCFKIFNQELEESEKHSAFAYMIKICTHLLKMPLAEELLIKIKSKLSEVYYKIGDSQSAIKTIYELRSSLQNNEISEKLLIIEASSYIAAGEFELGKKIISELLIDIKENTEKNKLKTELAYADFELGKYDQAREIAEHLINNNSLNTELVGRCYNLKGMVDVYKENNLESALSNFQMAKSKFVEVGLPVRVSGIDVNIGNVYNILANYEKAEEYWKNASKINQSTGNLDQEGYLHQNFGMFYMERQKYDAAIDSFRKAQNIFLSYGKKTSYGLILINLGEVYLKVCEFEKSLKSLNEAFKLFDKLKNDEEACEALFQIAKVYYNVGYILKLEEKIRQLEEKLNKTDLPKKHLANKKYLRILLSILKEEKVHTEDVLSLQSAYKNLDERNLVTETKFMLIDSLIKQRKYNDALTHLSDTDLIDLCSQNSILEAEREYFLGIISGNYATDRLLPPLVHFEKAYEIINGEHISELIWKVLFSISEIYIQRGNFSKAKRYVIYARELIYFIAEKIESPRLRAAYLGHSERINTLRKLESFYPSI